MVAPFSVLTYLLLPSLIENIFGLKWAEFEYLVPILMVGNVFLPLSSPSLALANALGHSRIPLTFALVWMAITWIFGIFLIPVWGLLGYGLTLCLVHLSNIFLFFNLKKHLTLNYLRPTLIPWMSAVASGVISYFGLNLCLKEGPALYFPFMGLLLILPFTIIYTSLLYLFEKKQILSLLQLTRGTE
jgi:O-antigen/teichoic acid export membrane protein